MKKPTRKAVPLSSHRFSDWYWDERRAAGGSLGATEFAEGVLLMVDKDGKVEALSTYNNEDDALQVIREAERMYVEAPPDTEEDDNGNAS